MDRKLSERFEYAWPSGHIENDVNNKFRDEILTTLRKIEADKSFEDWSDDLRRTRVALTEAKHDPRTGPCPTCGRIVTVERKPFVIVEKE